MEDANEPLGEEMDDATYAKIMNAMPDRMNKDMMVHFILNLIMAYDMAEDAAPLLMSALMAVRHVDRDNPRALVVDDEGNIVSVMGVQ